MTAKIILQRDKDGFIIPAPRAPKKKVKRVSPVDEEAQMEKICSYCNKVFDMENAVACSAPDCALLIQCDCFYACIGAHGKNDCEAIWCRVHAPRCSKICRIDNCHSFLCDKHVWRCNICRVDACGLHVGEWNLCDFCSHSHCEVCLIECDNIDCKNLSCLKCGVEDSACLECQ